jgi:hypothetical protein
MFPATFLRGVLVFAAAFALVIPNPTAAVAKRPLIAFLRVLFSFCSITFSFWGIYY